MPALSIASASPRHRAIAFSSAAGKRVPAARSAMRLSPVALVTGMMPAMIGARIPASSQRARQSWKAWLSKKSWVTM